MFLRNGCQVYLWQRAEVDAALDVYALHLVFQRRQQRRELSSERVGAYGDVLRIVVGARIGLAADARGVTLPCADSEGIADVVVLTVQRERLIVECQLYGGNAYVVLRQVEAHGQCVVAQTAAHTTYEVHQRGVSKVVLHGAVEVERSRSGPASARHHRMSAQLGFYEVLTNGYGDVVFAITFALHHLAILVLQQTVDIYLHTLDGHIGTCIVDMSAHGERRHVLEVGGVDERILTHEEKRLGGVELMDAKERHHRIGRSLAGERYALDDVVAVSIGLGLQLQRSGREGGGLGIAAHETVVLVVVGAVARVVEQLCAQTFVKGPIGLQSALVAHQQVVEVLQDVGLAEAPCPQAELICQTLETSQAELFSIGQG